MRVYKMNVTTTEAVGDTMYAINPNLDKMVIVKRPVSSPNSPPCLLLIKIGMSTSNLHVSLGIDM